MAAKFNFGFREDCLLQLNGQKQLRLVAEDLISNNQKKGTILSKTVKGRTL